ncbi:MAG: SGNH/GDSL hydrolase family protein, partial [Gammaproteobacteria bacterium]
MNWTKLFFGLVFLVFQLVFLSTIPEDDIGSSAMVFIVLYQIVFVFFLFLIWKGKYLSVAITLLLLLFLNLFTANEYLQSDYKTLPPNMKEKVRIVGDVMPGFNGVNTISTDSRGFRVTKEVSYDIDTPIRVFAIGGSTTEEINSDDRETWPALLEDKLAQEFGQDVEVINTGLSGLRAKNHLATLLRTENLYPDYYVFLVGVNDWNKQIRDITNAVQPERYDLRDTVLYRSAQMLQAVFLQSSHVS